MNRGLLSEPKKQKNKDKNIKLNRNLQNRHSKCLTILLKRSPTKSLCYLGIVELKKRLK